VIAQLLVFLRTQKQGLCYWHSGRCDSIAPVILGLLSLYPENLLVCGCLHPLPGSIECQCHQHFLAAGSVEHLNIVQLADDAPGEPVSLFLSQCLQGVHLCPKLGSKQLPHSLTPSSERLFTSSESEKGAQLWDIHFLESS